MKLSKSVICLLILSFLIASCNSIDFKKTKGGVPYKLFPSGSGDKIAEGNIIKYMMTIKIKDSIVRSSYNTMPEYERAGEAAGTYEDPHMELFLKAKTGDSIYYVQAMDSFIAKQPTIVQQSPWRKGDRIQTGIKILKVYKNPADAQADYMKDRLAASSKIEKQSQEAFLKDPRVQDQMKKDNKIIEDYLSANHIQATKTAWGTYVQILTPGQGPKAENGKFAMVRYKGTNMAGEVFDTNDKPGADLYPVQIGASRSIIGFEDGLKQLSKGSKARLFIPSALAYGPRGNSGIKPNENLIFDVEMVDISDNPPAQKPVSVPVDPSRQHK
jgi:FKBP-type peptidyl-prolyl cis-trans isomerase FkpA